MKSTLHVTRTLFCMAAIAIAGLLTSPVGAHEDHGKPQYGGIFGEAGSYQAELVAKADALAIYLTEHGKPLSAKGASAKLTILAGGVKSEATLAPSEDGKRLEAKGSFPAAKGTRFVAQIARAGQAAATVRYEIK
jgi:hypothetical protein